MDPKHAARIARYNRPFFVVGIFQCIFAFFCFVLELIAFASAEDKNIYDKLSIGVTVVFALFAIGGGLFAIFGSLKKYRGLYVTSLVFNIITTWCTLTVLILQAIVFAFTSSNVSTAVEAGAVRVKYGLVLLLIGAEFIICITQAAFACCLSCPNCCLKSLVTVREEEAEMDVLS